MSMTNAYLAFLDAVRIDKRDAAMIFQSPDFQQAWSIARVHLSVRLAEIMERRYGTEGGPVTLKVLGLEQRVGPERIRKLEQQALRVLTYQVRSFVSRHEYQRNLSRLLLSIPMGERHSQYYHHCMDVFDGEIPFPRDVPMR